MSRLKYHRNNKHRYNIYESHTQAVETKSFYLVLRNTLFFIALILSLLVTSLVSFDSYKKINTQALFLNPLKSEITELELTKAISDNIIQEINKDNSFEKINQKQLKRIIKNVMEKVKNSPNQIIYTSK
jgi:uncharacterized coiled-coil protein SlyX